MLKIRLKLELRRRGSKLDSNIIISYSYNAIRIVEIVYDVEKKND